MNEVPVTGYHMTWFHQTFGAREAMGLDHKKLGVKCSLFNLSLGEEIGKCVCMLAYLKLELARITSVQRSASQWV